MSFSGKQKSRLLYFFGFPKVGDDNFYQVTMQNLFTLLRHHILTMSSAAGSGHPTSSLSAVELMGTLFAKYLQYDIKNITSNHNDRVIFSKGHASPLFYALYRAAGVITQEEMLRYRLFDSPLEGHPTRRFPFTEAATGSLGQGLAIGVGQAIALKKSTFDRIPRVYVLMGDGELAEGSVWEAAGVASHATLHNLIAICDINRLGQSQPTSLEHQMDIYRRRFEAFGWGVIVIDGHDEAQIDAAYQKALLYQAGPTAIIAQTKKGKGISFLEDKENWHGKALTKQDLAKALEELGSVNTSESFAIQPPAAAEEGEISVESGAVTDHPPIQVYTEPTATRKAFGDALVAYAEHHPNMIVVDGDVMNSTYTEAFAKAYPDRFIECFIAEQTMVGVATGLWCRGYAPWVSTFAAFLSRGFDQIRMAGVTGATIHFNGSHAGVSIGADGGSQMGLEDIAMFRAVIGSTVLYPADAHASHALMLECMKQEGVTYLRTTRDATPILYPAEEVFPIGGSKVHPDPSMNIQTSQSGLIVIISAGITLFEALAAQKKLAEQGKAVVVIDCYSIKPIDEKTIVEYAQKSAQVIVVEDHYPEGGLGETVAGVLVKHKISLPYTHLAVRKLARSGSKDELLHYEEINADAIIKEVV